MTSSLTTTLKEMRRENYVLKTDNIQLRTDNDAVQDENKQLKANSDKQMDEIGELKAENAIIKDKSKQLTTLFDKMIVNNDNQMQQINSQSSTIAQLRSEVQQLKVSQWSGIT